MSKADDEMTLVRDGAQRHKAILDNGALGGIRRALSDLPPNKAGIRLKGNVALNSYLSISGLVGRTAQSVLGAQATPVRAILFDKTPLANWTLGWHQDRTIAVQRRAEVAGYGPWSIKAGLQHVEPPFDVLAEMVTIRVHLDEVGATNAPLLIAPGSHHFGRVAEVDIRGVVEKCGVFACLAEAGDAWVYATPIIHASNAAESPTHRRVLQVDYAAQNLPAGLDWLGI